jgi:hypothetical protein
VVHEHANLGNRRPSRDFVRGRILNDRNGFERGELRKSYSPVRFGKLVVRFKNKWKLAFSKSEYEPTVDMLTEQDYLQRVQR